jgi:SpoVK/Ycf46/Vps4 family AAA+-type ATPase
MPKISRNNSLNQWAPLLRAVRLNEAKLAGVAPFRQALEGAYTEAVFNQRAMDAIRETLREATRRRNASFAAGYDAAIALRHFIKSVLGPRAEELRLYGMTPRGPLCRSRKKPVLGFEQPS